MHGRELREFHVFLSSPGDVGREREAVRSYFEAVNRTAGPAFGVRFQVIDWSSFASAGVGRPQALITAQTLERYRDTLVLVIVLMAQRFGTPSGAAGSGTEEEARWALAAHAADGLPEVKFFFRQSTDFATLADPDEMIRAAEQWKSVKGFQQEITDNFEALVRPYPDADGFAAVLRTDLDNWLHGPDRPWAGVVATPPPVSAAGPPVDYFRRLAHAYQWLDISGIDSDRAFKLPLDRVYVRLRVIAGDETEATSFPIQTALERFRRLVIVGDPGSGKSTFLRFIALTLAQCRLADDPRPAADRLALAAPLPTPIVISCWDLAEDLRRRPRATLDAVIDFIVERLGESAWPASRATLDGLLTAGEAVLLVDGLDEVPTEDGRHLVARLIEELVERYPDNRYVVTSRIRAYTGETILGERFARCDIQPFALAERTAFLENWVGQLFSMRGDEGSPEATAEIAALTEAIETSSIRSLAVNPLLLTVIAIVHWNRKRLPEQRVELYDECVDVLLGQRKQAELQRTARDTRVLDEKWGDDRLDQRSLVRKRFAEIAFNILERSDEEIDRRAVVALLEPHFGTPAEAERFLDRQELQSGLFVRRRASSYRFVHLTFQEYLAAWYLANQDLDGTLGNIRPHLRDPKWFETLQLLGGALANRSDAYLDRYVGWLLDQVGASVREQAPVIALCANVVRDTASVATIAGGTRARYEDLLRQTLDAFARQSRIPKQTQLDLLEAMGNLGASVKNHLIAATGSRLLEVRRRALEILVPHLSDDDLFAMSHVLRDRSREPILAYLVAITGRDPMRAGKLVLDHVAGNQKLIEALADADELALPPSGLAAWPALLDQLSRGVIDHPGEAFWLLRRWADDRIETSRLLERLVATGMLGAVEPLVTMARNRGTATGFLRLLDTDTLRRLTASPAEADPVLMLLHVSAGRPDGDVILHRAAATGSAGALWLLLQSHGSHAQTLQLIRSLNDEAVRTLAERYGDSNRMLPGLLRRQFGPDADVLIERLARAGHLVALQIALAGSPDEEGDQLLRDLDNRAVTTLARSWNDRLARLLAVSDRFRPAVWQLFGRVALAGSDTALWLVLGSDAPETVRTDLLGRVDGTVSRRLAHDIDVDDWIRRLHRMPGDWPFRWELVWRWAAEGIGPAVSILLQKRGDDEDAWHTLTNLGDRALGTVATHLGEWLSEPVGDRYGRPMFDAFRRCRNRPEASETALRLTLAGSTHAAQLFREIWGDGEDVFQQIRPAAAKGNASALRILLEWWPTKPDTAATISQLDSAAIRTAVTTEDAMGVLFDGVEHDGRLVAQLRNAMLAAGSLSAMWACLESASRRGEIREAWAEIARLTDDALDAIAAQDLPQTRGRRMLRQAVIGNRLPPEAQSALIRLVAGGSVTALHAVLATWGHEESTRAALARLPDRTVEMLARTDQDSDFWYPRDLRQLVLDLAHLPQIRDLLRRMAAAGSHHSVQVLAEIRDDHPETVRLFQREVSAGSAVALQALVRIQKNAEDLRKLLAEVITEENNQAHPTLVRTAAWYEWAIATGGADAAGDLRLGEGDAGSVGPA